MRLTIIISYYKAIDNLKIILNALNSQSYNNFEVVVSEDDFNQETIDFIIKNKPNFLFPIHHLFQDKNMGFRKNAMLNRSILHTNTDFLVFIDGDCIPHKHFVKEYAKNFREGYMFIGRAVMLCEKLSRQVLKTRSLDKLNFISVLFSKSKKKKDGIYFPLFSFTLKAKGLVGRNWGIFKKHLLDINGFDEDYVLAGVGEDADIEWRLFENGIKKKSIKNKAIVYHINHKKAYSEVDVNNNYRLFYQKQENYHLQCLNGIEKITIGKR